MPGKTKRADGVVRKITHPVRFAPDEYEMLKEKAYQARISMAEFIRRAALRQKVVESPPPPQLNWKLYSELNAIGRNLNQIAKSLNTATKLESTGVFQEDLEPTLEALDKKLREIELNILECGASYEKEVEDS